MIDFKLSEQQNQIKEMTQWFAENEIRPIAMEAEKLGRVPDDWLDKVNKMGIQLNTSAVGGGYGGSKSGKKKEREGTRMGVLATEEMAWGDPAVTISLPGAGLGGTPVQSSGTPEHPERFIAIFSSEESRGG